MRVGAWPRLQLSPLLYREHSPGGKEAGEEPAEVSRSCGALAAAGPTWRLLAPRAGRCVRPPSAPGFPPLFALVRKGAVLGWPWWGDSPQEP